MDITKLFNEINIQLAKSGRSKVTEELQSVLEAAVTGSEGLVLTGQYLLRLKTNNISAYNSLKH